MMRILSLIGVALFCAAAAIAQEASESGFDDDRIEILERLDLKWDAPFIVQKVTVAVDPAGEGARKAAQNAACGENPLMDQEPIAADGMRWTFVFLCAQPK